MLRQPLGDLRHTPCATGGELAGCDPTGAVQDEDARSGGASSRGSVRPGLTSGSAPRPSACTLSGRSVALAEPHASAAVTREARCARGDARGLRRGRRCARAPVASARSPPRTARPRSPSRSRCHHARADGPASPRRDNRSARPQHFSAYRPFRPRQPLRASPSGVLRFAPPLRVTGAEPGGGGLTEPCPAPASCWSVRSHDARAFALAPAPSH